jgi:LSD1 subclass zinc finger protein
MPIIVACSQCRKSLQVPDQALGKTVRCPLCQKTFVAAAPPVESKVEAVRPEQVPPPLPATAVTAKPSPPAASPPPPVPDVAFDARPERRSRRPPRRDETDEEEAEVRPFRPLRFAVVISKDPDKQLKGRFEATLARDGLRLKSKEHDLLVPVGTEARHAKGHVLTVTVEDRQVDLAIFSFTLYKELLAHDVAEFLQGKRRRLNPDKYRLPWYLYLPAFLPLGIPIITLGGAIPGALGFGVAGGCIAVAQRERWSVGTRLATMLGLVVAGYLGLAGFLVAVGKFSFSKQQPVAVVNQGPKLPPPNNADPVPPKKEEPKKEEPPPNVPDAEGRVFLPADAVALAFAGNNPEHLVTVAGNGTVRLWDTAAAREIAAISARGVGQEVTGLAVAPDGARAVIVRHGGAVEVVDLRKRQWELPWQEQLPAQPAQWAVAWSADGSTVATANGDRSVRIWDVPSRSLRHTLSGHKGQVHSVAVAPDSTTVASGDGETVHLWNARTGKEIGSFKAQDGAGPGGLPAVWTLAFSPDGKLLAAGGNDGSIRLRDLATSAEKLRLTHGHPVGALAFSTNGAWLASAGFGGQVKVWNAVSGAKNAEMNLQVQRVHGLAFQPSRTRLAITGGRVILWDVPVGAGGAKLGN